MEENQQEMQKKILEIRMLEAQAKQFEEQIMIADQQIMEIQAIQANLNEIKKIKNQDMLAPLSRDMFIEVKVESGNSVLVNVGAGIIVKKSIEEAKDYMENQKQRFFEARSRLAGEFEKIVSRIMEIEQEISG